MSMPDDKVVNQSHELKDADDNHGIVTDDALQKVNPAAAERVTDDHDPHHIAKDNKQYDSPLMTGDKLQSVMLAVAFTKYTIKKISIARFNQKWCHYCSSWFER